MNYSNSLMITQECILEKKRKMLYIEKKMPLW